MSDQVKDLRRCIRIFQAASLDMWEQFSNQTTEGRDSAGLSSLEFTEYLLKAYKLIDEHGEETRKGGRIYKAYF